MDQLVTAIVAVVGVPAALVGYILLSERLIQVLPEKRQGRIRPWFWIAPAVLFLFVFLIYPTINTIVLSFLDAQSRNFVGLDNYIWFIQDRGTIEALRNSVLGWRPAALADEPHSGRGRLGLDHHDCHVVVRQHPAGNNHVEGRVLELLHRGKGHPGVLDERDTDGSQRPAER